MNRVTIEYQTRALRTTRQIISVISHDGVLLVTDVANTLANSTIAFGFVSVTRNPKTNALPCTGACTRTVACLKGFRAKQSDPEIDQVCTAKQADRPGQPLILDKHCRQAKQTERCIEPETGRYAYSRPEAAGRTTRHRGADDPNEIGSRQYQGRNEIPNTGNRVQALP